MLGGIGGNRLLGLTPSPGSWNFWSEVSEGLASVSGIPFHPIDFPLSGVQRVAQRAKPSSAGGDMTLLSSRDGACSSVPSPLPCDTVKILYDDATRPRGDGFGIYQRPISSLDILHLVLWLRGGSRVSTLSAPITAFQISKNTFVHGSLFWGFFVARHIGWQRFVAKGPTISRLIVMLRDFCAASSILLWGGTSGPSTI